MSRRDVCRRFTRTVLFTLLVASGVLPGRDARAQAGSSGAAPAVTIPAPGPETWAGQLDTLARYLEQRRHESRCTERCYTLQRLRITGSLDTAGLTFELEGNVLADGPVAVPLFGPPSHVRVEQAMEDGRPASIGFEGDHYYLYTSARRFVLRGTLVLQGDLALAIPGPLNVLEADLTAGRVVEGARLSGLAGATIHFDRGTGAAAAAEPTVFQLSRAIRVSREVAFEYRLVMRSGTDLGVVHLPLRFGERVLDVTGSTGWSVVGGELVLPTSGRAAQMTITGSMARVAQFAPDPRSTYEWWLFESDPEHRVAVGGNARQLDSAESPIRRTQPTSRLYLVQRGQHLEVTVQSLVSTDVLAAVVRSHTRTVVLTSRGDLVADDSITYDNNGIDYLLYTPSGRAIYLGTDGTSERIMHREHDAAEILVPLRTGNHSVRTQSLAQTAMHPLFGMLEIPMPSYPLTASTVQVTVGLPHHVHPVAVLGGDRIESSLDWGDLVALCIGALVAWVALRTRQRRLGGTFVFAGLWFLAPGAFVALVIAAAAGGVIWIASRFLRGPALFAAGAVALMGSMLVLGITAVALSSRSSEPSASRADYVSAPSGRYAQRPPPAPETPAASTIANDSDGTPAGEPRDQRMGNFLAQNAEGGVLQGVTPVALTLPGSSRSVHVSRELVTRQRPFHPSVVYITDYALLPFGLLWLLALLLLLRAHRDELVRLRGSVREILARQAQPAVPVRPEPPANP